MCGLGTAVRSAENYTAALGRVIFLKRLSEGRLPGWLRQSYPRTRGEGKEEEEELSPWDSSDGDAMLPAGVLVDELLLPGGALPPHAPEH